MDLTGLVIRNMHRHELDVLVDWAAAEGWNPGLSDADVFWTTDPDAFIAAELGGVLVGGGSIVSYDGVYGFMGFFIVHPDYRGEGLGHKLWHKRLHRLIGRLHTPATIGMDGVFDMQAWYAKGGFEFACRDLRFEGVGRHYPVARRIVELDRVPFTELDTYDRRHFPAPRRHFLKLWITQPGSHALGIQHDGHLAGYAVLRRCRKGHKIGPLFADNASAARDLFRALVSRVSGESVYLDVPENNPQALALASSHDMQEVFGCAKMYYGPKPVLPDEQVFGVTTFEFG